MAHQFTFNRPDLSQLVSKLRIKVRPKYRKMSQPDGLEGRLRNMKRTVTALIKYERLELTYSAADEGRGYVERLISEAIRHGDTHKPTMEMADKWILEKQLIYKLFNVLVPRFANYQSAYTSLYKAPLRYPESWKARSVLELKGNPFPPLIFDGSRNKNLIHNILLEAARKDYGRTKYEEIAKKVTQAEDEHRKMNNDPKTEREKSEIAAAAAAAAQEVSEGEQLLKSKAKEDYLKDLEVSADCDNDIGNEINPDPVADVPAANDDM